MCVASPIYYNKTCTNGLTNHGVLSAPKKFGLSKLSKIPDTPSNNNPAITMTIYFFPSSAQLLLAHQAAIINPPTKIPKNPMIKTAVITILIKPPINLVNALVSVVLFPSPVSVVLSIHFPTKGILVLSSI